MSDSQLWQKCVEKWPMSIINIFIIFIAICMLIGTIILFLHSGPMSDAIHKILISIEYSFGYIPCFTNQSMIPKVLERIFFIIAILFAGGTYLLSENLINYFHEKTKSKNVTTLFFILLVIISLIPLFSSWCLATPGEYSLGGLLPYSDAFNYYNGAEHLLDTGTLDSWSERRPINAILFATRLLITKFDFKSALILQSLFFGITAALSSIIIARKFGLVCGLFFYGVVFTFASPYLQNTASESLGISLGCLSFFFLLLGIDTRNIYWYMIGSFILGLALLSRAGAMMVIPVVIVASALFLKNRERTFWIPIFLISLVFMSVFAFNSCILTMYGSGEGAPNWNFAYTIYGLSVGSDWTQSIKDFPNDGLTAKEWSDIVYQRSIENIISNPKIFLHEIIIRTFQYGGDLLREFLKDISLLDNFPSNDQIPLYVFYISLIGMIFGGIRYLFTHRLEYDFWHFILGIMIGLIISLPFMDGGIRIASPIVPFIAGGMIMMVSGLMKTSPISNRISNPENKDLSTIGLIIFISILIAIIMTPLLGPILAKEIIDFPENIKPTNVCPNGTTIMMIRYGPNIPQINVISETSSNPTFLPKVRFNDYNLDCYGDRKNWFPTTKPGFALILTYDYLSHQTYYLETPITAIPKNMNFALICTEKIPNKADTQIFPVNKIKKTTLIPPEKTIRNPQIGNAPNIDS